MHRSHSPLYGWVHGGLKWLNNLPRATKQIGGGAGIQTQICLRTKTALACHAGYCDGSTQSSSSTLVGNVFQDRRDTAFVHSRVPGTQNTPWHIVGCQQMSADARTRLVQCLAHTRQSLGTSTPPRFHPTTLILQSCGLLASSKASRSAWGHTCSRGSHPSHTSHLPA